jgi:membrane fusion protein, multidrug efflux system
MEKPANPLPGKKKKNRIYIPVAAIITIVLVTALYYYRDYAKYISSDDAKVDADNVSISAKMMGRLAHLYVGEGDSVQKGMLLADLDSADLLAQKNQAIAARGQALSLQTQAEAKYRFDLESIKVLQVNLDRAQEDFSRAKEQLAGDVITREQFDHSKHALESAQAQLDAAKTQLLVSKAQISNAIAGVGTASAWIGVITSQLNNTRLNSPFDGIVAKRWLLSGDIAQPGQSILTIINNRSYWISVFLEETKLGSIRLGQRAVFHVDAFPGVTFTGKVFYIGSTTAAQFSLIPANNASGNFTKVTQRVALKISIDSVENAGDIASYQMISGMSAVVKIIRE